jgi:hypothetical protein
MRRLWFLLVLVGCGDNAELAPDASRPDGTRSDAHVVEPRAVAVGADFQTGTGTVSKLEVGNLAMTQNVRAGAAQGDPVIRQIGNELFVINRFGFNNITILNARTLELIKQVSTGASSNPQDVAVVGDKLYVPTLGGKGVLVINRSNDDKTEIDLATPLGDADGKPDCVSAYAVGNKVFVACSLQTNFASVLDSKIAVIDAQTDTYVTSATTPYKNPFGFFQKMPDTSTLTGDLLIPLVDFGDFGQNIPPNLTARCVARVSTGAQLQVGCAIQNADLGGYPGNMSVSADGKTLYLAVAESFSVGKLREWDLSTGMLAAEAVTPTSQLVVDVAACPNGDVAITDGTTNMTGVRVYRGKTERTTAALSIGMPPVATGLVCYDAGE